MSKESVPIINHEKARNTQETAEVANERLKELREQYEKNKSESVRDDIEAIRKTVENIATKEDDPVPSAGESSVSQLPQHKQKELAYTESLELARRSLSKNQQKISRIIHTPQVEKTLEVMNKTIMRPSVFTGAMIASSIGTILLIIFSKYYGYDINTTWSIILLIVGASIGILVELILRIIAKRR